MEKNQQNTVAVKGGITFFNNLRRCFTAQHSKEQTNGSNDDITDRSSKYIANDHYFKTMVIENRAEKSEALPKRTSREGILSDEIPAQDVNIYYKLNDKRKRIAVVFNHLKFKPMMGNNAASDRNGTEKDCKRIRRCLRRNLGFETEVHEDPELKTIRDVIKRVSSEKASEVSCIVVVVMTHGETNGILLAHDHIYPKSTLFDPFLSNTQLIGVPKLFFIQACRGSDTDGGVELDGAGDYNNTRTFPTHADFLVMYSTVQDYVSWRDKGGSWFIQSLCEQLEMAADPTHRWDLLQMLTFVNNKVAHDFESRTSNFTSHRKKQMPQIESTLTKLLKFSPAVETKVENIFD